MLGTLPKNLQAQVTDKAFFPPTNEWCLPAPSVIKLEEKRVCCRFHREHAHAEPEGSEFSRIGNRKSLSYSDDVCYSQRRSANKRRSDSVCQRIVFIRDSNFLEDTPAVLSLGKLCKYHRYSFEWTSGRKPQLIKNGRRTKCNTANYVPIIVLGLSTGSSQTSYRRKL